MLRQIEMQTAQGKSTAVACKEADVFEQSCDRWRREDGGLKVNQAKEMKDPERENLQLRRPVVDLSLGGPRRVGCWRTSPWDQASNMTADSPIPGTDVARTPHAAVVACTMRFATIMAQHLSAVLIMPLSVSAN